MNINPIVISANRYINVSVKLTKNEKPIYKMMESKNKLGILVTLDDITQFIQEKNRHEDKNTERQIINRLVKKGIVKSIGIGLYVLTEYEQEIKKNIRFPILPTSIDEKKDQERIKKSYYEMIKPYLDNNIWSDLLTHDTNAKLDIHGIYKKMHKIHTEIGKINPHKRNKGYTIPFNHPTASDRKFLFHFYPNDRITLQIGTTDNPIKIKEDFYDSLIMARKILLDFISVWGYNVPALSDWTITISHVHRDTINKDYKKYIGGLDGIEDDYGLGIHLYDHDKRLKRLRKFLRVESKLTWLAKIDLNPEQAMEFFERNDPFKILNHNHKISPCSN